MSSRDWNERIQDILYAIREIQKFVQGMDFGSFQQDLRTIRAVELNFIIIGEAANHIPEEIQDAHPEIPWNLMKSMRNRLVHVYFSVDPTLVWDTIQNDLPSLAIALESLH